jgi:sugar-specific transcriptional regulator TrmB
MLEKQLIGKLCKLGLTNKQAKIYEAIATSKSCYVKEISENSGIYAQDVYQILPTLERYGLVTRVLSRPMKVEAVSVETALNNLLNIEEQKLKDKKKLIQEIIQSIKIKQELSQNRLEPKLMILHDGTKSMENLVEYVIRNAQKKYDAIFPEQQFTVALPNFKSGILNVLAEHGIKAQILVRKNRFTDEELIKMITSIGLGNENFTIKATGINDPSYFAIIDDKEVWVVLKHNKEKTTVLSVLVTDNEAIVIPYKKVFQSLWTDPETTILL